MNETFSDRPAIVITGSIIMSVVYGDLNATIVVK
jgi:hypothetical protein